MSLFPFPFKRKTYPGVDNPRFVSDILAANEAVQDGLKALSGFFDTDFAILSGFLFEEGFPGNYGPGICWLNGQFYYSPMTFNEGFYLQPANVDTMNQPFGDTSVRPIYNLQQVGTSVTQVGTGPKFTGGMSQYRISLRDLNTGLAALNTLFSTLGNAAFLNVGVVAGTVAAGDDARFGYTKAQIDLLFALKTTVLLFGNTTPFTPILPYEPATKQYVDQAGGMKLRWVGTIDSAGAVATRQAGDLTVTPSHPGVGFYTVNHGMGTTNYFVTGMGFSNAYGLASPRVILNQSTNSFQYSVSDDASQNDFPCQLAIIQYFP